MRHAVLIFLCALLLIPAAPAVAEDTKRAIVWRATSRAEPALGLKAVRLARSFVGVPYRYAGASPSGFDCSGLTSYVYAMLGVELPHNAAAQLGVGRPVRVSRLEAGDLLIFEGLGHVGLYAGNGTMIHAPESGRDVEVTTLREYGAAIAGARRVIGDASGGR